MSKALNLDPRGSVILSQLTRMKIAQQDKLRKQEEETRLFREGQARKKGAIGEVERSGFCDWRRVAVGDLGYLMAAYRIGSWVKVERVLQ